MIGFTLSSPCPQCKSGIMLPTELFEAALHNTEIKFYCSYGHACCFVEESARAHLQRRSGDIAKAGIKARNHRQDAIAQQSLPKIEGNIILFPRKENNSSGETQA